MIDWKRQLTQKELKNFKYFSVLAGGRCLRTPRFLAGGAKPPRLPPLKGRSSHLIEAAKRGRLDQMLLFFSAADDTGAADDCPAGCLAGRLAERPAEH